MGWIVFAYFITTFLPPLVDEGVDGGLYFTWVAIMTVIWAFALGVTALAVGL